MSDHLPFVFSLLTLPLLAGMIIFILVRRPRQPITWTFAGVMAGLIVFYLADVVLYQPGLSMQTGLIWQFVQVQGANLTILSALALNFLLRDRHLKGWEWALVGFIVVRMVLDSIWLLGLLRPDVPHSCQTPQGLPRLTCPPAYQLAVAMAAISAACVALLYVSTAYQATEPKRHVLRRYILWVVLLIVAGAIGLQVLYFTGQVRVGVAPGEPATLLAILLGLRLFLALEEEETGVRFPAIGWRIMAWFVLLIVAMILDLSLGWLDAPIWTLGVLAASIAGAGALLINSLARHAATALEARDNLSVILPLLSVEPVSPVMACPIPDPLCIYLFGPMRVVRNGESLANTAEVWRSAKTRSLLVYLALRREAGVTQVEIVDAFWPVGSEPDAEAERSSLSAFRSYLSTLRRVLDPEGPRGSDRYVTHEGERYTLRADAVWVDVWEFEELADQAEALLKQDQTEAGLACWRQALALYAPAGLLPDETNLPADFLEPLREHLRQRWLAGMRRLARHERDAVAVAELWEAIYRAEPLDDEACAWLIQHYRRTGNTASLRLLLQRRRSAEAELDAL